MLEAFAWPNSKENRTSIERSRLKTDRPIPRATYRLQLTKTFNFNDAARLAPYLSRLGISHAYLSLGLKARRGSSHGYDTVDHGILNPELGTQRQFEDMVSAFRAYSIGVVLDSRAAVVGPPRLSRAGHCWPCNGRPPGM
ncbi:MAG: alpha-amylase family glycosyl hydrolase [Devosia sp.]